MKDTLRAFVQNAWDWDYEEFCSRTGVAPGPYAEDKFRSFQKAADLLRQFDDGLLADLSSR